MNILIEKNNIMICDVRDFDLTRTLECGQCFRWNKNADNSYTGVAFDRAVTIKQDGNNLCFFDTDPDDFKNIWYGYFDLDRDYLKIIDTLSADPVLKTASQYGKGIHLLRQDTWETIVSFIISASNNIPRIKKIIELFCENFGHEITYRGKTFYTFPTPEELRNVKVSDLDVIRAGFRDKYIIDAIEKVNSGELDLKSLNTLSSNEVKKKLLGIYGIGNKVADCIMLFGLSRYESFPVDVWIKRIMEYCYFDGEQKIKDVSGFAHEKFGDLGGFAQQYLFYYAREEKIK